MRKLKSFVGVFLVLMQYFWLFMYAYEIPPEDELIEEFVVEDFDMELSVMEYDDPTLKENATELEEIANVSPIEDEIGFGSEDSVLTEDFGLTDVDIVYSQEESAPSLPLLIVSEVYFGGTDERFELYNPHDTAFMGSIQVVGVKSSILDINNLTIPAKTARVFGDSMVMISEPSVIERSALALNLVDTTPIAITLLYNGQIIDSFNADTQIMATSNKTPRASLQKTLDNLSAMHISPTIQNYNNIDPSKYTINPGFVYDSFIQQAPAACENRGSTIQISEIFRGIDDHAPYIELYAPQGFSQNITLGGSQLTEDFDVFVDQPAGHYHIVTLPENSYSNSPYISDNQKLSLASGLGNVSVYGHNGQVLDKVDILVREDGYASYSQGQGCQRVADIVDNFSPGFAREYLSYFPQGAEKIITVTQQIVVPSGGGSCSGDLQTGSIAATATGDFVMEFVSIDYDPPGSDTNRESIILRSLVDYPLDLSVYSLRLSTRNGLQYLRGVLEPEEEITLTGNYRFPNAGACVDLLYGDFVVDSYCYPIVGSGSGELENDYSDISITIDHLNYDPPGDDTNNEEITFTVHTGVIDFSHGFYVLINGRKNNLTAFGGERRGTFILKANYRMPNTQDACISLLRGDFVFDTKCYVISKGFGTTSPSSSINTDWFSYNIHIDSIDYDPEGSDTNNEKITLFMENGSPVDLSQFHILINGTKKKLKETLTPGIPLILVGTYGFPNAKQTCVVLQYQDHVYDSYCYDPEEDKQKAEESLFRSGRVHIDSIIYDPTGNDTDREEIHMSIDGPHIDLSKGWYLLINTTKKSLSNYGSIDSGSVVLTGTFAFPNAKDSCVSIRQYEIKFDEYCYQIDKNKNTEKLDYTGVSLNITAIFPNPIGADSGKERVEVTLESPNEIDLSQGFTLLINGSKKKLTGIISGSDPYRITGSFSLPNTASCISFLYYDTMLDTFCYPQTKEGLVYSKNTDPLLALTDTELTLLKNTTLTKLNNKICLTLSEVTIKCRNIPAGKLAARQFQELQLSRNYITMLHDYLYNHWQLIYFNSDIVAYKTLFDISKQDISSSQFTRSYGSEKIPISDIQTRFQLQYNEPLLQQLQGQMASKLFGPKLTKNYTKAKERYYNKK